MSYQIQYDNVGMKIEYHSENCKKKPVFWKLIAVVLAFLCIYALKSKAVQDYIIPGDTEITRSAFQELHYALKEGQPFTQAFYAFCENIVQKDELA